MTTEEKQDVFEVYMNFIKRLFIIATVIISLFIIAGQFVYPDEQDRIYLDCKLFEAQWEQVMENGERIPVEIPGKVTAAYGEVAKMVTVIPENIHSGQYLCFRTTWQDAEIYIDGELRARYNTSDSRPFGENSAFRYVFVEIEKEDAGKELTYCLSSKSKYAGVVRDIYIGDRASIWGLLLKESGTRTIISCILMFLSLFCIIVCIILRCLYKMSLPLHYLAWTIFLCTLWMLSESEFRQLVIRNVSVFSGTTYWGLMLIPLPLLLYMNMMQKRRYEKVYLVPLIYSSIVLVIGTMLQVLDSVQFVAQLPFIHLGLVFAMVCIMVTILIDVFTKKIKEYMAVGIGVCGLLLTGIIELLLYYVELGVSIGTVLALGLMFLLFMAIVRTGQDLLEKEQKRNQAIVAKDAQSKFLANMSHEIRTPINAIVGMNEMILRENENRVIQNYAQNVQSASNMLLKLVNDILDFSKIESGQLELVEDTYFLAPLIQDEILLLNARIAGKPISTKIEVDPMLPSEYWGDELRIKQILTNLLSNAVKYTNEGSVTLKVFFEWLNSDNILLCFSVIDTGIGIKEKDIPHLFDSFKRFELNSNRNVEGTGLGLNIAKQLVELMRGSIRVDSKYGEGSTFTVVIPQRVMDKRAVGSFENSLQESRKKKQKAKGYMIAPNATVMVVDDNAMNLSLVKALLKRTKVKVDLVDSGRECLALTRKKVYDMILMDHMMPGLDGVETLRLLRGDFSNPNQKTTVVALTANAVAGSREMYLKSGFDDYLSKPIQPDKLDALLAQHLDDVQWIEAFSEEKGETDESTKKVQAVNRVAGAQAMVATEKENFEVKYEQLLQIDRALGLNYCLGMEDIYQEAIFAFCEQVAEYLPQLEMYYKNQDWKNYTVIAHSLKGNALNIGAENFSKLSLEHQNAAEQEDVIFLRENYEFYVTALKKLVEKLEKEN